MAEPREFYYPLQDKSTDIDRVIHDFVTLSNDEENTYKERITDLGEELFVKGVINEDGYIHFIFDDVQSSRPIEVNEQEVPIGDGQDWVKPSDFYTAISIHEYETTDTSYNFSFGTNDNDPSSANWVKTDNYIFTKMQIVKDSEIVNLLNEESILSCMQIGSYKVQPLTSELIETMKSFFTNGEDFFNEHKYGYYCGSDLFNYAYQVTDKYYLYFDVDENDQEVLVINQLTRSGNVVSLNTTRFSNIHILIDLYDGDEFQATVNVNSELYYHNKITNSNQTIEGKDFAIKEYSRTVAETRYFGSEFSSEDSYYAPQLVFGSDPRGRKGFANSCNITLRGRGKAFLDDDAYAHFMGNSFLKMEGTSRIIARNDGDLLVDHGKTILGQTPEGTVPEYENFIDKNFDENTIFIVDDSSLLAVQQAARVLFGDGTNFQSVGHAWVSLSDETYLDMAGQSRIAAHTSPGTNINNALLLDNHGFIFQSDYHPHTNSIKPVEQWIYDPQPISKTRKGAFLYAHYPTLESVPTISKVAQYIPINTRLQTFMPIFDNSIVFIDVISSKKYTNLNVLNAELHTIFPQYNIDDYYLLGDAQLANLLEYFQNTPTAAELVPDFFTRDQYYLTKAERDILYNNYPSSPVRYYYSERCLQPLSVKQAYDFKTKVIDKLNTLSMFNIDCLQIYSPSATYIFYDMIDSSSVPSDKSATNFVLKKTETEPRLSGHQNNYSTYYLNQIFEDKSYYVGKSGDYDPSSPNSTGYYYLSNIVSNMLEYQEGTVFKVEGPGTSVIIGDDTYGRQNIRVSGGFINLDITGGKGSDTMLKLGANEEGKLQLYITGDDAFFEIADNSHFEMHNSSNFILDGNGDALKTKTGLGHRDHLWMTPWSKPQSYTEAAPTLQLYHNSSLSMYGTQDAANNKYCTNCITKESYFDLDITIDLLTTYANSSETELNAGAQFLLDYIYNGNPVPGDRYDEISILDSNIASSIFAVFTKMNQGPIDFRAKSPLIGFTATDETYDSSLDDFIEPGTTKCIFKLTEADSSNDSADCKFEFRLKNFLVGSDSSFLRVSKQPNSPLMELAENAEFRMWGNTYLKITDAGITIKDNSVNTAYTFTVAELQAAIEGGGSGPSYPDAEDIQV